MTEVANEPTIKGDIDPERIWWFFDTLSVFRSFYKETGGSLTFVESIDSPGSMPPLHVHPDQDEAFYMIEGSMRLYVGRDVIDIGPGEFAMAPRKIPHTFKITSETTAHILGWVTGPFDEFVQQVGKPAPELRLPEEHEVRIPDPEFTAKEAAERGIIILGPPGMLPTDLPEYADGDAS